MLRLSRLADYGIVLLAHMATDREPQVHSARALGDEAGIPQPTVAKILKALCHGGILESERGPHGGYRLARPAATITVDEVITVLEGPIAMTDCAESAPEPCEHEAECLVRTPMQAVNRTVRQALRTLTLAELAHPADPASPSPPLAV